MHVWNPRRVSWAPWYFTVALTFGLLYYLWNPREADRDRGRRDRASLSARQGAKGCHRESPGEVGGEEAADPSGQPIAPEAGVV